MQVLVPEEAPFTGDANLNLSCHLGKSVLSGDTWTEM